MRTQVAVLAMVCLASTACAAGESDSQSEKTLAVGVTGLPKLLVPSGSTSNDDATIVTQVYDGLVAIDPKTKTDVVPALAKRWEVSDDGLHYTFHLREGVEFQDGAPFDANAVKMNYDRLANPKSEYYWPVGAATAKSQIFGNVEGLTVDDADTVTFNLAESDPDWLIAMTRPYGHFISPKVLKSYAPGKVAQHPVGTGPFEYVSKDASTMTFRRNPDYWDGAPPLDGFVIRAYPDDSSRVAALAAHEINLVVEAPFDSIKQYEGTFSPFTWGSRSAYIVAFNTKNKATSDRLVRQALNYAVDKKAIASRIFGGAADVSTQPFARTNAGFDPTRTGYPHDPEKARRLLAQAGYEDGLSIKAIVPTDNLPEIDLIAQAIQADLKAVGVELTYDSMEWTSYLDKVGSGLSKEYAFYTTAWAAPQMSWLQLLLGTENVAPDGSNRGYYSNPNADELMAQGDRSEGPKRKELYQEAQKSIVSDAPWLFLVNYQSTGLADPSVKGIRFETVAFDLSKATIG